MKKFIFALLLFVIPSTVMAGDLDPKQVTHLQNISVTVVTEQGSGSGIIKVRKFGNDDISFIFTAAHVVDGLRHVRHVIDGKTGTQRVMVEFNDAKVVRTLIEDGRTIGRHEVFAKVLKFNAEQDIAVLQVRQKNFSREGLKFYLEPVPPQLATQVVHVGSLLGEMGSNSVTLGIISQNGRLIDGIVYDQTTATAFPGSSGGGVFLYDGRMVGQVLRGAGENFVLIGPARRTVQWAKDAGIEWVVDDSKPVPTFDDLRKIVVEDKGIIPDDANAAADKHGYKTYLNKVEKK